MLKCERCGMDADYIIMVEPYKRRSKPMRAHAVCRACMDEINHFIEGGPMWSPTPGELIREENKR